MGYKHFCYFGLDKVKMDFALFVIAFNVKKMVYMIRKAIKNGEKSRFSVLFTFFESLNSSRIEYQDG